MSLETLDLINFIMKFWPVLLLLAGYWCMERPGKGK